MESVKVGMDVCVPASLLRLYITKKDKKDESPAVCQSIGETKAGWEGIRAIISIYWVRNYILQLK